MLSLQVTDLAQRIWQDPLARKAMLLVLTWVGVLVATWLTSRWFDRIDDRLTAFGVPERRLNRLDFLIDLFLVIVGVFVSLSILGVGQALWGAVALTSVAGVMVALAAQQLAQNLLAGIMILFERPFAVREGVRIGEHAGVVQRVTLFSTSVRLADGPVVLIPNRIVLDGPLINYTLADARRLTVTIDITDDVATERVEAALRKAAATEPHLIPDRPIEVFATDSLDEGTRFRLRYWVAPDPIVDHCEPTAMQRVLDALASTGIATALPAQRVHVLRDDVSAATEKQPGEG